MTTGDKPKVNKINIALLGVSVVYCLLTMWIVGSGLLRASSAVVLDTLIYNTRYAIGFFYLPFAVALLTAGALTLKLMSGSRKLAQRLVQFGLLLTVCLTAWDLTSGGGLFPAFYLNFLLLFVVVQDLRENRQRSTSSV